MTHPIHLMFPELEGYTAAIPSKRDMLEFTKAITAELVAAALDADSAGNSPIGLLHAVCREAQKAVHLMLSKVEGMVLHVPNVGNDLADAGRLVGYRGDRDKTGAPREPFCRTTQQENNAQLWNLLAQVRDVMQKLPAVVSKSFADSVNASVGASMAISIGIHSSSPSGHDEIEKAISSAVADLITGYYCSHMDELATPLILNPIVGYCSLYCKSLLFGLPSEKYALGGGGGAFAAPGTGATQARDGDEDDLSQDCSGGVRLVYSLLPSLLQTHLLFLSQTAAANSTASVIEECQREVCLRALHAYISAAALLRPVTEASRMRIARDMTALESLFSNLVGGGYDTNTCPVFAEYRAFRRFIFEKERGSTGDTPTKDKEGSKQKTASAPVPDRAKLVAKPYFTSLRPSTVLNHLISCAPIQMPAAHEAGNGSLVDYLHIITAVSEARKEERVTTNSANKHVQKNAVHIESIRSSFSTAFTANSGSSGSSGSSARSYYSVAWHKCAAELETWHVIQAALDVFIQRTAVISEASSAQGKALRSWADALQEIGSGYFGTK
jgi:hypothetical protein